MKVNIVNSLYVVREGIDDNVDKFIHKKKVDIETIGYLIEFKSGKKYKKIKDELIKNINNSGNLEKSYNDWKIKNKNLASECVEKISGLPNGQYYMTITDDAYIYIPENKLAICVSDLEDVVLLESNQYPELLVTKIETFIVNEKSAVKLDIKHFEDSSIKLGTRYLYKIRGKDEFIQIRTYEIPKEGRNKKINQRPTLYKGIIEDFYRE